MFTEEIYRAACGIYGGEQEEFYRFIPAAEYLLTQKLREGVSPEDCGEIFITAAAFIVLSMYKQAQGAFSGGFTSYKAGSVSVSHSGGAGGASAQALAAQAEALMAPFSVDDGFSFRGVDG